jgi:mannose-6-phosphate isomerase
MHLFEAMLAAFRSTRDEFWLMQAERIELLFRTRLIDQCRGIVFEYRDRDWSVAAEGRVEIGHQFEWSTLLLELYEVTRRSDLILIADRLFGFALRYGFEDGLIIDAVNGDGAPLDRRKLFWSQLEAARHFSVRARLRGDSEACARATEQWRLIDQSFMRPDGWTWYNCIAADGTPVEEPALVRLLYHVVSARAELR